MQIDIDIDIDIDLPFVSNIFFNVFWEISFKKNIRCIDGITTLYLLNGLH